LSSSTQSSWHAELVFTNGQFNPDLAVFSDDSGKIQLSSALDHEVTLKDRAILPGLVNAHSHAFQRVIRGRSEYRTDNTDSFWTWREQMYQAANRLDPDDIYIASRMAFMEMALSGITSVGEFHYLHNTPDGKSYDEPNVLAEQVIRAANDVGLRIALLRVAYARAGFEKESNPLQQRFIEAEDVFLERLEKLRANFNNERSRVGIAPHSVRAVPLNYLKTIIEHANTEQLKVHMHVAEQPAEVSSCIEEYGRSPVALLDTEGLLSDRFTAVHAIHVTPKAIAALKQAGACVCACPTTERNLGDGVVPVDGYFKTGVPVSLGSDSHTQIDLLEDARELEYHLRLQKIERNVLATDEGKSALARQLFTCATENGAASIGSSGGAITDGASADFFTVDLNDPSIAGASNDDLLSNIVFSISRTAVRDVVVGGRQIVLDGRHFNQDEIVESFRTLQKKLWNSI